MDYQNKTREELINELTQSKDKYRFLIENINDIIYEYDENGILKYISPAVERIFGYKSDEIIGQNFIHFVGGDEQFASKKLKQIKEEKISNTEYEIKYKSGKTGWILLSTRAVFTGDKFSGGAGTLTDITERKLIEIERNRSEQLYRSILNASPDTITITDLEGKILFTSPSTNNMFGYPASHDFSNLSNLDFIDKTYHPKAKKAINDMFNNEFTGAEEYVGIKANGMKFDIEVNGDFIRDKNGNPVNMIFVTRDISQRKQSEEKLREITESYRNLVENINEVVYEIDNQGIVKYVSPAIQQMGYLPEEMIGQSFLKFAGKNADILYKNLLNIKHGEQITSEYQVPAKNGNIHWLRFSTKANYDDKGCFLGGNGTLVDVTEMKRVEIELQQSEMKYRMMVERINDVIFEVTSEGIIKFVSSAIDKVLGYTAEELTGKNFFNYMFEEDIPFLYEAFATLQTKDSSNLEYRYYKKDGSVCWVRSSTTAIVVDGKMVGGIGILTNINERKLAEEQLHISELRYKSFFEGNNSIMLLIDPENGDIKDANPAACKYYGWSKEQICKLHITDINTLARETVAKEMKKSINEKRKYFFFKHRLATGEIRDVEVYSGPIKFGDQTLLYSIIHDITERVINEEKLRVSEEKYRSIFETVQDAYYEASLEGILMDISPAIYNITKGQYTRNDLIGLHISQFYADQVAGNIFLNEIFTNGKVNDHEMAFYNKDGEIIPVSVSSALVFNEQGQPLKITGSMRDITERKQSEKALKASEEKYRSIFETVQDAYYEASPDGTLLDISPAIYNISKGQFTREELIGKSFIDFYAESDAREKLIAELVMYGSVNDYELNFRNKDGSISPVSISSVLITDEQGKPVKVTGSMRDIEERKKNEKLLQESEALYYSILEASPDDITITDLTGKILLVSPKALSMYGFENEGDLLNRNIIEFIVPENRKKAEKDLTSLNLGVNQKNINEYKSTRKDGSIFDVEVSGEFIKDTDGNPLKIVLIIRDISERKKAEEALKVSEEKYRLLFSNNPQPMWIYDLETFAILEVNQSSIEKYGYSRDEFLRMTIKDIRPKEDIRDLLIDVELAAKNQNNTKSVWRHLWKNGELRYVEINAQSIDFNGRKARHVLINDVTEKIQAENEIKNKSVLLTNLIVNLKEGILLESSDRKIALANQLFCDMFGINAPAEALVGLDCTDSAEQSKGLFKNSAEFIKDINLILDKKETVYNDELELVDGRYFERDYIPTYLDGIYNGHLWKYRDITERKNATIKLTLSEERFRQVVEQSQEVVWEVDTHGLYTFVSPISTDIYGYSPEELVGKLHFYDICPENEQKQLIEGAFALFNQKQIIRDLINKIVKPDLTEIIVLTNGAPILDEQGNLKGYRGLDIDITERIKNEENILKISRLKSVISSINLAILKEKNKNDLLEKVNEIAITHGKFQMSWIGFVDDATQQVKPYFINGFEDGYFATINQITVENTAEGRGPTGTALREGKVFFSNDIENDPFMTPWRDEALKRDYRSAIALPIKQFNKTVGVFSLYSTIINFFNEEEISLLTEVMDNIGFALEAIETEVERKRTENELRKVSQAVEQSPVSIVITNLEGNIEYVNPKACESTGYTLEELIGNNPRVLQSGETNKDEYKKLWDTIAAGTAWHGTFHNKRKNGELYWESSTIAPITDENGNITHYVAIKEDITHLKESEEALRQNEANLNYAQEIAKMGSWDVDYRTGKTTWSKNLYQIYEIDTVMGDIPMEYFHNMVHPEDLYLFDKMLNDINEFKTSLTFVLRLILPTGKIKWIENNVVPVLENNILVGLKGVNIDVSDKKQKDDEINRLSLAVTQSPVSVVITDLNGNIEFVNPAFEEVTGYTFEAVKGQNTRILKSEMNDERIYPELWNTITSGQVWSKDWINKKKNGEYYWEHISISPILNETGKIVNYLAIKQDISERKKYEQQILELNTNLEKRIEERTTELATTNFDLVKEINERRRIEEALSESEYQYRTVVENIHEVIFQTDNNGLWIFLNQSWEDITGYAVTESLGQLFLNYVHPDDRELNMQLFAPLISREKDYCRHQVRYLTKSGGFRWIEVFAKLGVNENDEPTGTYGTLQDITERKRSEEFEYEMLQLSLQLTGITLSEIDSALNLALLRIGNFLNADRTYIFEFENTSKEMSNTYEWCNDGIAPEKENLQQIPVDILPMWMEKLARHENIIIPSIKDLPESWQAEKEILEPQGIQSLIVIPMLSENEVIGFVGLDSVKEKRTYSEGEINILKIWSSMLVTLINKFHAEQLLEQTRQNFEIFFNTIDDFLWVLDDNGHIIHINNTVINRLGYSAEELESKSILLVHPEDRRVEASQIVGEMLEGLTEFCPVPVVTKQGKPIPVETRIKHGFWDGKPAIFGVSKDISKIQLSEQKFSTAFQSSAALMAISTFEEGKYIDINNTFIIALGYSREELIGKTNEDLNLFSNKNTRKEIINCLKLNIPVREMEVEIRPKAGEFKTILLSADTIFVGEERCLLTVSVDITDRKTAEEEIKKARLEAENANIAKSEFLSRMSHELRTPMNSILGFAQILEMGELSNGQRKGVNHIMRSGKHLLSLINEVLDISRIEAGRLSISIEPIKISGIFEEMLDVMRPLSHDSRIHIELEESTTNQLFVKSDRQSLKQVMLNLLTNSIKYNKPEGSVTIKTELISTNIEGINNIRISISDTGMGISSDDIPKLFTPFERIGADKTGIEGTGLGLAVVKKLIDAMGGKIGIESVINEGTTFWFELPQAIGQLDTLQKMDINAEVDLVELPEKSTILYIEDNISNIELVEQILAIQRPNIQLISNMNGKQAVSLAMEHKPSIILLDLNLPDMHGSEVLKLLLENENTKDIPVVIISADAMHKQVNKLISAGAKTYLTKPLEVKEFLNIIDEFSQKNVD